MLVLASASPRRRELLTQVGIEFVVDPADISEDLHPGEQAATYVSRIAEQKARAVYARRQFLVGNEALAVLGADTCVLLDGNILGKPADDAEAREMLRSLSGRVHQVLTGVALVTGSATVTAVETTAVSFDTISPEELEHYLSTGESFDKAGGYGIQGYAARWIPRIEGCYFNVMGLPLARTMRLLAEAKGREAGWP